MDYTHYCTKCHRVYQGIECPSCHQKEGKDHKSVSKSIERDMYNRMSGNDSWYYQQ